MTKASDVAYGRQGGRIVPPSTSGKAWHEIVPCKPEPSTEDALRAHLAGPHGVDGEVLARHTPDEWRTWHTGWHRTVHPSGREPMHSGHLQHTHRRFLPKKGGDK